MYWYGDYGHMGGGWFLMLIIWPLAILGTIALIRLAFGRGLGTTGGEKTALDILKERYARGEISRDEFENMRRDIEK